MFTAVRWMTKVFQEAKCCTIGHSPNIPFSNWKKLKNKNIPRSFCREANAGFVFGNHSCWFCREAKFQDLGAVGYRSGFLCSERKKIEAKWCREASGRSYTGNNGYLGKQRACNKATTVKQIDWALFKQAIDSKNTASSVQHQAHQGVLTPAC